MMRRTIDATKLYEIRLINRFWNGHHSMVDIQGVCRVDGQRVRYHQPWQFFVLRVVLYLSEHPEIDTAAVLQAVASVALDQSRRSWGRHDCCVHR